MKCFECIQNMYNVYEKRIDIKTYISKNGHRVFTKFYTCIKNLYKNVHIVKVMFRVIKTMPNVYLKNV